ncbi:class I SAM-dependent rRNA methyltransferase [Salsuginibacillus kocurii]|uniref:class I SAM-dependent rRNA methyltransferase n=1 Tax=Salsuginibacillus kocurii TaxID=427078 RepID=UPI0003670BD2|nr:class I SAM-dependent rRNA methyltransferase [Salsuginibacillus kocurii]
MVRDQKSVTIQSRFATKFKSGYPFIFDEALVEHKTELPEEGALLHLYNAEDGNFIGTGYHGRQTRGLGWVLTRRQDEAIDDAFFERKLKLAFKRRSAFFKSDETTAFRVFNGEGDGFGGLTIDYFDGYYLLNWFSAGAYSFKSAVLNALKQHGAKGVYEKKRYQTGEIVEEDDDFVEGERGSFPLVVKENGIHYAIHLNDGPMVGVFLDQRDVRKRLRLTEAKDKTVLNTFSYTGAFSVAAALGGAAHTTSVDLANRSYSKTIEQFSMNGLDYEAHDIIVQDVFDYFTYAKKKGLLFDLVVLDPPAFARSKKRTFSAKNDYTFLLKEAIALTDKKGSIIASTNVSTLSMEQFKKFVKKAFQESGHSYQIKEEFTLPADFRVTNAYPEGDYLKVLLIEKTT